MKSSLLAVVVLGLLAPAALAQGQRPITITNADVESLQSDKFEPAKDYLEKAFALSPGNPKIAFRLAALYEERGRANQTGEIETGLEPPARLGEPVLAPHGCSDAGSAGCSAP